MKKKIFISVFMILVSVAMITAATMAWFTDSANAGKAEFTAGTVKIEAGRIIDVIAKAVQNWDFFTCKSSRGQKQGKGY